MKRFKIFLNGFASGLGISLGAAVVVLIAVYAVSNEDLFSRTVHVVHHIK